MSGEYAGARLSIAHCPVGKQAPVSLGQLCFRSKRPYTERVAPAARDCD
jgi:hypothetical protein